MNSIVSYGHFLLWNVVVLFLAWEFAFARWTDIFGRWVNYAALLIVGIAGIVFICVASPLIFSLMLPVLIYLYNKAYKWQLYKALSALAAEKGVTKFFSPEVIGGKLRELHPQKYTDLSPKEFAQIIVNHLDMMVGDSIAERRLSHSAQEQLRGTTRYCYRKKAGITFDRKMQWMAGALLPSKAM